MSDANEVLDRVLQHVCAFITHLQNIPCDQVDEFKLQRLLDMCLQTLVKLMEHSEILNIYIPDIALEEEFDFDGIRRSIVERIEALDNAPKSL